LGIIFDNPGRLCRTNVWKWTTLSKPVVDHHAGEDFSRDRVEALRVGRGMASCKFFDDDGVAPLFCPTCQMASQNAPPGITGNQRLLCMGLFFKFCRIVRQAKIP
jgi:hypothetical protein